MNRIIGLVISFALVIIVFGGVTTQAVFAAPEAHYAIYGVVLDEQAQPVADAAVHAYGLNKGGEPEIIGEAVTQLDGSFTVSIDHISSAEIWVEIGRSHFREISIELSPEEVTLLGKAATLALPTVTLERQISTAFWLAAIIFIGMLILIATGIMHNTLAALLGITLIFGISYLGHPINESLYIFGFERSIEYIDWNVIFLIMGMMMVIAVVEHSGIFQWLAFFAYKISRGKILVLLPILMLFTGIASAFLDNVTTMLLMTPLTVQIALALEINPLALLIPEVMASNVIGVSTLVGTPTNILIGSYANISFNDFLVNLTPGADRNVRL